MSSRATMASSRSTGADVTGGAPEACASISMSASRRTSAAVSVRVEVDGVEQEPA